jgi:hypothetical protein
MDTNNITIQDLPNEMIMEICKHLESKHICRLALTCKRFKELFERDLFYERFAFNDYVYEGLFYYVFLFDNFIKEISDELVEIIKSSVRKFKRFAL